MHEEVLEEQRALVQSVEAAGWEVTDTELSTYESPWQDEDDPEATVTITARKVFREDGDDEDSRFRVK